MLDRSKVFALRELEVRDENVVTQVDPLAVCVSDGADSRSDRVGVLAIGPSRGADERECLGSHPRGSGTLGRAAGRLQRSGLIVVLKLSAGLGKEMERRTPATRDQQ